MSRGPRTGRGQRAAQTSDPMQFVSDMRDIASPNSGARQVTDPMVAATLMADETRSRLEAVLFRCSGRAVVLLSGGVDSIFVAATAVSIGVKPHAITVVTEGASDEKNAVAAAHALDLTHEVIQLTATDVVELARDVVSRLGTYELWEVTAAIPVLAAYQSFEDDHDLGPILTGSGADAILAGGRTLTHAIDSREAVEEVDRMIRSESASNFTYHRLVPNFYPALLGQRASHLIHVFQTIRFWEVCESFAPPVLFGVRKGGSVDKLCLRIACNQLLPDSAKELAWGHKDTIQRSTGIMGSLVRSARRCAAELPGARTYTDPATEPFDTIATRLYLALLALRP